MEKQNNISKITLMVIGIMLFVSFLAVLSSYITEITNPISESEIEGDTNFTAGSHELIILTQYPEAQCEDIEVIDATTSEEVIGPGNYTFYYTNCSYVVQEDSSYLNELVNVSYSWEYEQEGYIKNSLAKVFLRTIVVLFSLIILGYMISFLLEIYGKEVGN